VDEIGKRYEVALRAGRFDEVGACLTDDVIYWVGGRPPIGGEWRGRDAVLDAFRNHAFGLGPADWVSEDVWREWYDAEGRVIVEIRERSWLKSAPDDVIDQRTCVVLRFRDDRICELRDYTDSQLYEGFVARHRAELPKFRAR
jgi:ketosteroid isomerase-like protein